jgi:hypothetical protein
LGKTGFVIMDTGFWIKETGFWESGMKKGKILYEGKMD